MLLGRLLAKRNREKNRSIPVAGYIADQRLYPAKALAFGLAHMDYNGCEVIAAYHALLSLGHPMELWETAEAFSGSGLWLFGIFGTHPHAIRRFFLRRGFSVRKYPKRRYADAAQENVLIYSYWNPRFFGIHTVELHRGEDGYYRVMNYTPLRKARFLTPEALIRAIPAAWSICLFGISGN